MKFEIAITELNYEQIKKALADFEQQPKQMAADWPKTIDDLDNNRPLWHIGSEGTKPEKVLFSRREDAASANSLAQLSRLLWQINKGWLPDWENEKQTKFFILYNNTKNLLEVSSCQYMQSLPNCLYFANEEDAVRSMETHKELWLQSLQK